MNVIFLAGVHGVGKGYLGSPVSKKLNIRYATASQLIRDEKGHVTWSNDKRVDEVDDNQQALIAAVCRLQTSGEPLLLDGHFVLRDLNGEPKRLPIDVFERLHLKGVIVLSDEATVIAERLTTRDKNPSSFNAVAELAILEFSHAQGVCAALRLPLVCLHKATEKNLFETVKTMLGKTTVCSSSI